LILVTLGTQKFQMNRLVEAADKLALEVDEEVFIQVGNSTYEPKNCQYKDFVDADTYRKMIEECSVLITHSGVGSIMTAINAGKPVVVVPRLKKMKEHVDDHQKQIASAFASKNCVLYCEDIKKLKDTVEEARGHHFDPYSVNGGKIEDIILDFIDLFAKDRGSKR